MNGFSPNADSVCMQSVGSGHKTRLHLDGRLFEPFGRLVLCGKNTLHLCYRQENSGLAECPKETKGILTEKIFPKYGG